MAIQKCSSPILLLNFLFLQVILCAVSVHGANGLAFDSIYQFGDSISDTGNIMMEDPTAPCSKPPYGQNAHFFDHPTGRCSDGLLMVDHFARAFRVPLLNPYLEEGADFRHGANFAVAGCTALDPSELARLNITSYTSTNSSLSVQLSWFRAHLHSSCSSSSTTTAAKECKQRLLRNALVLMGEIGGNDFNYPLFTGAKSPHDLYPLVPHVVTAIIDAVQEVIDVGATQVVVPGNFPIGCMPGYLQLYASNDSIYDELNCLKSFNELAAFYNHHLQQSLADLRLQNPTASIFYADYYSALRWLLKNAASLGFEEDGLFKACCGKGDNVYNCNADDHCGDEGVPVCNDPTKRLSWDGLHLTQQAYKHLADWLISDIFTLPGSTSCPDSQSIVGEGCTYTPTY